MNERVHCAAGVNGTVVILSAWCRACRQQAMPDRFGACSWCLTAIVDEQTLSASDMLAQISGREPSAVQGAVAEPAGGKPGEAPSRPGRKPRGPYKRRWTRANQLGAIRAWASSNDRAPYAADCTLTNGLPSQWTLALEFGSFAAAIEAAGYPRPLRGRRKASGGVDVDDSLAPPPEELLDALKVA